MKPFHALLITASLSGCATTPPAENTVMIKDGTMVPVALADRCAAVTLGYDLPDGYTTTQGTREHIFARCAKGLLSVANAETEMLTGDFTDALALYAEHKKQMADDFTEMLTILARKKQSASSGAKTSRPTRPTSTPTRAPTVTDAKIAAMQEELDLADRMIISTPMF